MATRCDYRISTQERILEIEAPQERILPGRMIRDIVRNLETRYELYEYSVIKSERQLEEMDDVVATIPLGGSPLQKGKMVVVQRLHNSLYDPNYVKLEPGQMDDFAQTLEPGEELNPEDYTVALPADYYVMVTDDVKKFVMVATHLKLTGMDKMMECVSRLCCASITIQDEALMRVEYENEDFPELLTKGCDEFLRTPVYQMLGR
jgi:hypothetical protein